MTTLSEAARALGSNPVTLRQAITLFQQAVALDSTFVAAWGALSDARSLLYATGVPSPEIADAARSAGERALQLGPERPNGYQALGDYYRRVTLNNARALEQYTKGLKLVPGDADLLRGLGLVQQGLGEWDQAVQSLRRSWSLDPRSPATANVLGGMLLWTRRYGEALTTLDQALALSPGSLEIRENKAMVYLAQGDLAQARRFLAEPPSGIELSNFVAYISTYWDLYWALDSTQRALVKRLTPAAFDGDAGFWGLALAGAYEVDGDRRRAAAYGDSARAAFEQQLKVTPEDPARNVLLGVALAYMGKKDDAIRAGERGLALQPIKQDGSNGPYNQHQLARIFILLGEPEKALGQLEPLLKIPYYLSPGWLRIDPTFDPIRKHPRFQKLLSAAPVAVSR